MAGKHDTGHLRIGSSLISSYNRDPNAVYQHNRSARKLVCVLWCWCVVTTFLCIGYVSKDVVSTRIVYQNGTLGVQIGIPKRSSSTNSDIPKRSNTTDSDIPKRSNSTDSDIQKRSNSTDSDIPKKSNSADGKTNNALIHIRVYPKDGVGTRVEISKGFNFSIFNSFCDRHTGITAIVPVYSAAGNFKRRQAIRDTVGKNCIKFQCAVFFIVGVSEEDSVNQGVRAEYASQMDLLMIGMVDTYRDLNNKAMTMLDWLIRFCPQPKYVIHIIDDTYPNLRYFIDHMELIDDSKYILGRPIHQPPVVRNHNSKWKINEFEYPVDSYPTHVVGTAYAFLNSNCKLLMDAAFEALYVWVEDVWLTGMVRIHAGFNIVNVYKRMLEATSTKDTTVWSKHFCVHQVNVDGFYEIYNTTTDMM